jgi:hypothetical protein
MLPDSIPESVWSEFRAHRRKLKKPMTDYAEGLILAKLMRWQTEHGISPIDALNDAMEMGYQGLWLDSYLRRHKLNGYARQGTASEVSAIRAEGLKPNAPAVCASCGKPLLSGFVHSRKGRVHPDCV